VWFLLDAYRFLSIRKPTMTIAMIMAIVETVKWVSTGACGTGTRAYSRMSRQDRMLISIKISITF